MKKKKKLLTLCGVLAPVVYVVAVVAGGLLMPGFNHFSQPVSDLIAAGAPDKSLLKTVLALYNFLTMAFAVGLYHQVRSQHQARGETFGSLAALVLLAEGVFGSLTLLFPEDSGGMAETITGTGAIHIVLEGLTSLTRMLAMVLMGFYLRSSPQLRAYSIYSFVSVIGVLLSGGLAAVSVATRSPSAGLLERITIGGFLQWLFVIALMVFSSRAQSASPGSQPHYCSNR